MTRQMGRLSEGRNKGGGRGWRNERKGGAHHIQGLAHESSMDSLLGGNNGVLGLSRLRLSDQELCRGFSDWRLEPEAGDGRAEGPNVLLLDWRGHGRELIQICLAGCLVAVVAVVGSLLEDGDSSSRRRRRCGRRRSRRRSGEESEICSESPQSAQKLAQKRG